MDWNIHGGSDYNRLIVANLPAQKEVKTDYSWAKTNTEHYVGADVSVGAGTWGTIPFDTIVKDDMTEMSANGRTITFKQYARVSINAKATFLAAAGGEVMMEIQINGNREVRHWQALTSAVLGSLENNAVIHVIPGDALTIGIYSANASTIKSYCRFPTFHAECIWFFDW